MKTPTCKRRFRNCGEFGLCINIGDKGYVLAEDFNTFQSIFLYGIKGVGRIGKMFKTDHIDMSEGNFYDIRDYEGDDVVGVELISISSNIDEIDNFRRDSHFYEQVEGFCKNIGWKLL